jgi:hypothetical protein
VALQRAVGNRGFVRMLQRIGTRVTHPPGARSSFGSVEATFDGRDLVVKDGAHTILNVPGQSGKPITVRGADARACGGATSDSYLNNPLYIGIRDFGAIPEGRYRFRVTDMVTFSLSERLRLLPGGSHTDPMGRSLHGGDWGAGRVALAPVRIARNRFASCGNTRSRSGFYLHGGLLAGSSGCIDIGNDAFERLVAALLGYRKSITVTVRYTHPAPAVSAATRAGGRFTYPGQRDPTLWDRIEAVLGGGDDEQ